MDAKARIIQLIDDKQQEFIDACPCRGGQETQLHAAAQNGGSRIRAVHIVQALHPKNAQYAQSGAVQPSDFRLRCRRAFGDSQSGGRGGGKGVAKLTVRVLRQCDDGTGRVCRQSGQLSAGGYRAPAEIRNCDLPERGLRGGSPCVRFHPGVVSVRAALEGRTPYQSHCHDSKTYGDRHRCPSPDIAGNAQTAAPRCAGAVTPRYAHEG